MGNGDGKKTTVRFSTDIDDQHRPSFTSSSAPHDNNNKPKLAVDTLNLQNRLSSELSPSSRIASADLFTPQENLPPTSPVVSPRRARGYSLRTQLFNRLLQGQNDHPLPPTAADNIKNALDNRQQSVLHEPPSASSSSGNSIYESVRNSFADDDDGIPSAPQYRSSTSSYRPRPSSIDYAPRPSMMSVRTGRSLGNGPISLPPHTTWDEPPLAPCSSGFRANLKRSYRTVRDFVLQIKRPPETDEGREIPLGIEVGPLIDDRYQKPYINNLITSSIYNPYNFLPRQLIAQFSKLANLYFLIIAIMQMIPSWSTTGTYTTIAPLAFFVCLSMSREAFDDYRRHRNDRVENNRQTLVATRVKSKMSVADNGPSVEWKPIAWKNLKVGDIIKLEQDDWVPADIVLLSSDGIGDMAYIETAALDGETSLKTKIALKTLSDMAKDDNALNDIHGNIVVEQPNDDLYNFDATITVNGENLPLCNDNIIYRGSISRNASRTVGLVVFTGEETKVRMNAIADPRTKAPKMQKVVNRVVLVLVGVVLFVSIYCTIYALILQRTNLFHRMWYINNWAIGGMPLFMSFIIMFNTLIPLSLYVSMEIIKLCQRLLLQQDVDLYHVESDTPCEVRTATINEELGQVNYIFTDKTGTLTDNIMIFRKLSVAGHAWLHDLDKKIEIMKDLPNNPSDRSSFSLLKTSDPPPLASTTRMSTSVFDRSETARRTRKSMASSIAAVEALDIDDSREWKRIAATESSRSGKSFYRDKEFDDDDDDVDDDNSVPDVNTVGSTTDLLRYLQAHPHTIFSRKARIFLLSIALCHTCLPTLDEDGCDVDYQGSSPDELALIQAAKQLGYINIDRQQRSITLRTFPKNATTYVDEVYQIMDVIDFSSSRKRMSLIVKFPDNRICIICKGADSIIMERLKDAEMAKKVAAEVFRKSADRRNREAEQVVSRKSLGGGFSSRPSTTNIIDVKSNGRLGQLNDLLDEAHALDGNRPRKSVNIISSTNKLSSNFNSYMARHSLTYGESSYNQHLTSQSDLVDESLVVDEKRVMQKTLEQIDEFASEGLRTLVYAYRFIGSDEYQRWHTRYMEAQTSIVDRQHKIEEVAESIERGLELGGVTAIEDKLQRGVPSAIDKLRRAGIKMWMLTGDKRETAINIGYSCQLIKDYSTVIILTKEDPDLMGKMTASLLSLKRDDVAHCVAVIDGATLSYIEEDMTKLSAFIDLGIAVDTVICCRASPSQKATMVCAVRERINQSVTLAIGDGANDIAMIQAADVGIGITGQEGLQAARSSDYSIAQFRFLVKLLTVHGHWNYVRTCKYVLGTFYKEALFYLTQVIYQSKTFYSGTSLYENWSLTMFNTLFTSLPVLCIGIFEQDLKPVTLVAVPELYARGRNSECFSVRLFFVWLILGASQSVIVSYIAYNLYGYPKYNNAEAYPLGMLTYTAAVAIINTKLVILEMQYKTVANLFTMIFSFGGWIAFSFAMSSFYKDNRPNPMVVYLQFRDNFGKDCAWWAAVIMAMSSCIVLELAVTSLRRSFLPTDTDIFQEIQNDELLMRRLEGDAQLEMENSMRNKYEDEIDDLLANRSV